MFRQIGHDMWQRKDGDRYEMYGIQYVPYIEEGPYFAGGGTFTMGMFAKADFEMVSGRLAEVGISTMHMPEEVWAEELFADNFAAFELESFDSRDEALEYVHEKMGD